MSVDPAIQTIFDRFGRSEVKAAFEELMGAVKTMMDLSDWQQATALVVVQFDPETGRRSIHGPFPKGTGAAMDWAKATKENWERANQGDGPEIVFTVELLFEPTD